MTFQPVEPAPAAPPAAARGGARLDGAPRGRRWTMNALIVASTFVTGALIASYATPRADGVPLTAPANDVSAAAFLATLAAAAALCWRMRSLTALTATAGVACLPGLLLPTDSLPALIGMASVIVWHPDVRARLAIGGAATASTFASIWRDSRGTRADTSFWNSFEHPEGSTGTWSPMPWWQVAVITAVLVTMFAGAALIRRARRDVTVQQQRVAQAQVHAKQAQQHSNSLAQRVAEQDEREALAREVHDVLGHRLSILSMQANALEIEAQAAGSRDVEERARQIQQGASGSMADLRSLLTMLRTGAGGQAPDDHSDLADIADLVRECIDAGTPVSSNVFVDQTHPLDPVISRSAYRITTELLTNARKHAPGQLVQLDIRGDAQGGIVISTANPLRPAAAHHRPGDGGTGLAGVARRAHDIGGSFWAGPTPDGRRFTASATLPWALPGRR